MPHPIQDFSSSLPQAIKGLEQVLESIRAIPLEYFGYQAPIIDRAQTGPWRSDQDVAGHRKFVESVETQLGFLQEVHKSGRALKEDPLPNVNNVRTIWVQILLATPPITAIKTSLKAPVARDKGKGKAAEGFIDVIHQGGAEWIKIYSKKQSQLLAEFREHDSYINSDYEDSDDDFDENGHTGRSNGAQASSSKRPIVVNSLLSAVDQLRDLASKVERVPGAPIPKLSLLITRLSPHPEDHEDERIGLTMEEIECKSVELVFADGLDEDLSALTRKALERLEVRRKALQELKPTLKINLDPTALMGLCSDVLHHPLPEDAEGAKARFYRPLNAVTSLHAPAEDGPPALSNGRSSAAKDQDAQGQSQNSRELVRNVLEEMEHPLIEELRYTIEAAIETAGNEARVEFWATAEAVTHCREAFGSEVIVGEGMEQRRIRRLLGLEAGDFFEGSRYEGQEGVLKDLRVKIFREDPVGTIQHQGSFFRSLAAMTRSLLADYDTYLRSGEVQILPNFLKPGRMPIPKVATLSQPFPIVSLKSTARGAEEGMTTLMMGNIVLRDLFSQPRWKIKGWSPGQSDLDAGIGGGKAAVWMMPYRTLGEGKRVRFAKGDYSYPNR